MAAPQDKIQSLGDYVAMLRRRWSILVTIVPGAILLAVFLAYTLPTTYQSSATILLEPSSIPAELVQTTVVSYADQQIELVQRAVMTPDRLEAVVEKIDPYPADTDVSNREKARWIIDGTALQKVDPITLEPLVESAAFQILYVNEDPQLAAAVTEQIADLFLAYNREVRTEQARGAYNFLLTRSEEIDKHIRGLEQSISDFKTRYGDALPESRTRNEASLDRTQRDLDAVESEIRLVEQQESMLKLQLSQISPTLVASGTDAYMQLNILRAELAAAQQKYTADHPDIRRLTRAIDALTAQVKTAIPSNVRPDNPDYLRVAAELDAVQRNLGALRSTANRARMQQTDYERRLALSPTVERDYVQLVRDREIAQAQFEDIQNKLREAEIAQSLESQARGERYTLIRPARVPSEPFSPNRLGVILIGIVLGGGIAVGLAAIRESSDATVRGMHDVSDLSDVAVIGSIPTLHNHDDRRRFRLIWGSLAGGYLLAIALVVLAVMRASYG